MGLIEFNNPTLIIVMFNYIFSNHFSYEPIDLDSTDEIYKNDTKKMLEEKLGDMQYSGKYIDINFIYTYFFTRFVGYCIESAIKFLSIKEVSVLVLWLF